MSVDFIVCILNGAGEEIRTLGPILEFINKQRDKNKLYCAKQFYRNIFIYQPPLGEDGEKEEFLSH
jgi:hypothetical protein